MCISFSQKNQVDYTNNSRDEDDTISALGLTVSRSKWEEVDEIYIGLENCSKKGVRVKDIEEGNILAGSGSKDGFLTNFYRVHTVSCEVRSGSSPEVFSSKVIKMKSVLNCKLFKVIT